jgi:hypothetical protein
VDPKRDDGVKPVRYRGHVDVRAARAIEGREQLLRLNEYGALPLRQNDRFIIEAEIDPPAYLYVVWVDPDHDVTPVYPWNPTGGPQKLDPWKTRPPQEQRVDRVTLPPNVENRYRAPAAKPGMATIVMFARAAPLDVPDAEVEKWFKDLPELALPAGGAGAVVWFENFRETDKPNWLRAGFVEGASTDAFTRWQAQLQKAMSEKGQFQTAVSFARTGNTK